jgi:CRISPR-associated protein Csb3
MAQASIAVDVFNPGQVFACLGFLEAADLVCGGAEGGFEWAAESRFALRADGAGNPFEAVLEFLAQAEARAVAPHGWQPPKAKGGGPVPEKSGTFPAREPNPMALPVRLRTEKAQVLLSHWCEDEDDTGQPGFKLYAGNRSALKIATDMLQGATGKQGKTTLCGVATLWKDGREDLVADPLGKLGPMGGSFNFDPRGAWTGLDVGYSLNDLKGPLEQKILASPILEILAAWGLEHARPVEISLRLYRYVIWGGWLPPLLARVALCGGFVPAASRRFRFPLELSGKNKIVSYATEENTP